MDDVKEKLCFVPLDVPRDLQLARNNERFLVLEMLFHPSNLGMSQAGLAEASSEPPMCALLIPAKAHNFSFALLHSPVSTILFLLFHSCSIILTDGIMLFPRFAERLEETLTPCP
ncbi:hypothetical protein RJ641_026230 [Dillenia turbinata]|uniref:Uncharacterized protein n=1 Tax=Dillenia turbinata TaxID=194707 RepID=A0AAN8W2E6_9MAGN